MSGSRQNEQQSTFFTNHSRRIWLLGGVATVLLLIAAAILLAPRLLASSSIKQKIQEVVLKNTGGSLDYRAIDLCYVPQPGIELQGVSLVFPEQMQGSIARLRISPKLWPLLRGNVQLLALRLDAPQLTLELPAAKADAPPAQPLTLNVLQEKLNTASKAVGSMPAGLKAVINDGKLTLKQDKNNLISMAGLDLQGNISATETNAAQAKLALTIAELNIFHHKKQQTITDISLSTSAEMSGGGDTLRASLDHLSLGRPRLALSGELSCTQTKPNCTLDLTGKDIDVAAGRATALALAGNTTPIKEIFTYLRGGRVAQISFSSQAEKLSDLGKFANILIKGQLQNGKIAVPEIKLELSEVTGEVLIDKGILQGNELSARLKNSTAKEGSLKLGLTEDSNVFQLKLTLHAELAEIYPWLASLHGLQDQLHRITEISGQIDMVDLKLQGGLDQPAAWEITSAGTVRKVAIKTHLFPATIEIADGAFTMEKGQLRFNKLKATSQDTTLTLSGSVKGFPRQLQRLSLSLDGRMGKESFTWFASQLKLPNRYTIQTPFTIRDSKVSWQPDSTASFTGLVSFDSGPVINADVDYSKDRLQIHQLTVKDQYSDAAIAVDLAGERRDGTFSGRLRHETLQSLFVDVPFAGGQLEGDLALSLPSTEHAAVTVKGQLTGDKLPIVLPSGDRMDIDHIMLHGDGPGIKVDIARLTWEKLSWSPVQGIVSITPDSTEIHIIEAGLCGIDSPGTISTTGDKVSLDMSLTGQGLNVADSYTCLTNGEVKMTGKLDFESKIKATGQADRLVKGLQGPLQMTFSNGVIEQDKMIARILEVLNVTEIIKGRLPNLVTNGLAYKTMTIEGRIHDGQLSIDKYYMDGETLGLLGKGEINLLDRTIDMQMLASPFQIVDSIVKHVPGVNYILAGSLVSIPISISGEMADPKVRVLSVSAVSSSLFNLAKRTIDSPFKLLDALNPWSKNKD